MLLFRNQAWVTVVSSLCITLNNMGWAAFYTLMPETFPTEIRGIGVGWASLNLKLASILSPFITGVMLQYFGVTSVVVLYSLLMMLAGSVGFAMKETKGSKTL